jgi:hypothetical protein
VVEQTERKFRGEGESCQEGIDTRPSDLPVLLVHLPHREARRFLPRLGQVSSDNIVNCMDRKRKRSKEMLALNWMHFVLNNI